MYVRNNNLYEFTRMSTILFYNLLNKAFSMLKYVWKYYLYIFGL